MSKQIKFIIFLLLVCFLAGGRAQVTTNLEILRYHFVDGVIMALDSLDSEPPQLQIVLEQKDEMGEWWMESLREALLKKQIKIRADSVPSEKGDYQMVLKKAGTFIKYRPEKRNLLLKTSAYQRIIEGTLSFILKKKKENILLSRTKQFFYSDDLKASAMKEVENKFYLFSYGTKTESKFIKRLVEPVLVTATTAGVIYLFYSMRSGS